LASLLYAHMYTIAQELGDRLDGLNRLLEQLFDLLGWVANGEEVEGSIDVSDSHFELFLLANFNETQGLVHHKI
jgi:hypothetical protein